MNKAVFLDRDGVINRELGRYCENTDEFLINDGVGTAIKMLKDAGYLVIVISNQGGIAKGIYTQDDVLDMHSKFYKYLESHKTTVDDFYFCPHHDKFTKCLCRKPNTLLFEKAMAVHKIDPSKSYMIGDGERDVEAAEKVGIKGIKIESNTSIIEICKRIASK